MIGHTYVNRNTRVENENIPSQQWGANPQSINPNIEKDRNIYKYYKTIINPPGILSTEKEPALDNTNIKKTRFEINPGVINMKTATLSFQVTFPELQAATNVFIPSYYFPFI